MNKEEAYKKLESFGFVRLENLNNIPRGGARCIMVD